MIRVKDLYLIKADINTPYFIGEIDGVECKVANGDSLTLSELIVSNYAHKLSFDQDIRMSTTLTPVGMVGGDPADGMQDMMVEFAFNSYEGLLKADAYDIINGRWMTVAILPNGQMLANFGDFRGEASVVGNMTNNRIVLKNSGYSANWAVNSLNISLPSPLFTDDEDNILEDDFGNILTT